MIQWLQYIREKDPDQAKMANAPAAWRGVVFRACIRRFLCEDFGNGNREFGQDVFACQGVGAGEAGAFVVGTVNRDGFLFGIDDPDQAHTGFYVYSVFTFQSRQGTMTLSELRDRLKPPGPTLDVHVHPLDCFGAYKVSSPAEDVRLLVASARRSGVEKMCVFSLYKTCPREPSMDECRQANDYVLKMRDCAPEVILPFCYVTPAFPEESAAEIDRCVGGERMCGVKLWVARRATDPGLDPIMERAAALGVPVLQHAWDKTTGNLPGESFPWDVADLARRHPDVHIIMAHLNGCGLKGIASVADCPNLVVDTSGGDPESGMVEAAVNAMGPERVVFGSDSPIRHFAVQMGKTLGTTLPEGVKRDILWNNAARLLPEWAGVKLLEDAR